MKIIYAITLQNLLKMLFRSRTNYETDNSWCYDDDSNNCDTYGRLYDWETALIVCPDGWHLPNAAEWNTLTDYLDNNTGGKMKSTGTIEAGTGLWNAPNTGATNESGWSGLPGGGRHRYRGYGGLGDYGFWWSSTEFYADLVWGRGLNYDYGGLALYGYDKTSGFPVRCLRD